MAKSNSRSRINPMIDESFKPIPVKPPSGSPILFWLRCQVDLQLGSIAKALRPAMSELKGDILDVGAGESPWREWLPRECAYCGIDIRNADDYGMSKQQDVIYYDGRTIPFPEASFDGAICIEVLEHVEDPEPFMAELARVLKPQSILLLTVPWSARRHHIPHDYHRFTKERLQILLERAGFQSPDIRERGNDISAIASKLVVLTIRLVKPGNIATMAWSLPIAAFVAPLTILMLAASHASMALGLGAEEDPLGYFVSAVRAGHVDRRPAPQEASEASSVQG
jgi:SAM-dependent methyltransferase